MSYAFKELKHMKVAELREIAKGLDHEAVQGYTQLNKDHLLEALCKALHIDMHEHHVAVGLDKTTIKQKIKALKAKRDKAILDHDKAAVINARKEIKALKLELRRAMV